MRENIQFRIFLSATVRTKTIVSDLRIEFYRYHKVCRTQKPSETIQLSYGNWVLLERSYENPTFSASFRNARTRWTSRARGAPRPISPPSSGPTCRDTGADNVTVTDGSPGALHVRRRVSVVPTRPPFNRAPGPAHADPPRPRRAGNPKFPCY